MKRYLYLVANTFMVRVLPPWSKNIGKRVVKASKIYIADTGLLHALLDIPSAGALHARPEQCYFCATHQGAELDLLIVAEGRRRGFEFKRTDVPGVTKSVRVAIQDLGLESIDVVHAGRDT